MSSLPEILAKARDAAAARTHDRSSPRFQRVVGKMLAVGLLVSNEAVPLVRGKIKLKDYLWAATLEPRLFELLPALVLKCPGYFSDLSACPADLKELMSQIRKGVAKDAFRGVSHQSYMQWLPRVGRRDKEPTALKSFRLTQADLRLLRQVQQCGYSEVGAIRHGLRLAAAALANKADNDP